MIQHNIQQALGADQHTQGGADGFPNRIVDEIGQHQPYEAGGVDRNPKGPLNRASGEVTVSFVFDGDVILLGTFWAGLDAMLPDNAAKTDGEQGSTQRTDIPTLGEACDGNQNSAKDQKNSRVNHASVGFH